MSRPSLQRKYRALYPFQAENPGEVSVEMSELVLALSDKPNEEGWLQVKTLRGMETGLVPFSYLVEASSSSSSRTLSASQADQPCAEFVLDTLAVGFNKCKTCGFLHQEHASVAPRADVDDSQPIPKAANADSVNDLTKKFASTLSFWQERERRFKAGEANKLPPAQRSRRYVYYTPQGQRIGPLDETEMRARLEAQQLSKDTLVAPIAIDGSELKRLKLSDWFASSQMAFQTAPIPAISAVSAGGERVKLWFYLDDAGQVQGPFSAEQMRAWFEQGYFSQDTMVKLTGVHGDYVRLGTVFPTGDGAFMSDGVLPPSPIPTAPPLAAAPAPQAALPAQQQPRPMMAAQPAVPPASVPQTDPAQSARFCQSCGSAALSASAQFCAVCGANISPNTSARAMQPPIQQQQQQQQPPMQQQPMGIMPPMGGPMLPPPPMPGAFGMGPALFCNMCGAAYMPGWTMCMNCGAPPFQATLASPPVMLPPSSFGGVPLIPNPNFNPVYTTTTTWTTW